MWVTPGYPPASPCRLEGPGGEWGALWYPRGLGVPWGYWVSPGALCAPWFRVPHGHGAPCVPHPGLGILWVFWSPNTLWPSP